jgi:hypothetical protein|tara:strand:+ start:170 stop:751 length:582 start_codon:yes stop_codon:yes gene_type:complete
MANGTLKVSNIETSSGSGTITLGQSGETIALGSGASQTLAANTPAFSVYASSSVSSISSGTATLVSYDTENYDTDDAFDNTSGNYKFTVPSGKAGKYFFQASVLNSGGSNNDLWIIRVQLRKNGTTVFKPEFRFAQGSSNGEEVHSFNGQVQGCLDLAAGDYIQIYSETYAKTGTVNISSGQSSVWFTGFKLT